MLPGLDAARAKAIDQARSIMVAEVGEGRLCMSCSIEVRDEAGTLVLDLAFKDAVELSGI